MNSDFRSIENDAFKTSIEEAKKSRFDSDSNVVVDSDSLAEEKSIFLRKVFMGNDIDSGDYHKLVVTAIHAVLLESGFLGFDPNTNLVIHRLCFPDSRLFSLSLYYTLPDIKTVDTVVVKFQSVGKFIIVYGSLNCGSGVGGKVVTHMVRLNDEHLLPFFNLEWANCGVKETIGGTSTVDKEVLKFWRAVKDNLAWPLLIDICDKAGLGLPPCFMRLPADLKLRIMELLSAKEIAKVGSTCSEIRRLALTDELWRVKCEEEFGKDVKKGEGEWNWKRVFELHWMLRRTGRMLEALEEPVNRRGWQPFASPRFCNIGRYYAPPRFSYIGRDYDTWPNFGGNAHVEFAGGDARVNLPIFSPLGDSEGLD